VPFSVSAGMLSMGGEYLAGEKSFLGILGCRHLDGMDFWLAHLHADLAKAEKVCFDTVWFSKTTYSPRF
jgi:hypothetical protein